MTESTTIKFGELRKIRAAVRSTCGLAFEITNATYSLEYENAVESTGKCELVRLSPTEIVMEALINPKRRCSTYILRFNYDITPERLVYECFVRVI